MKRHLVGLRPRGRSHPSCVPCQMIHCLSYLIIIILGRNDE